MVSGASLSELVALVDSDLSANVQALAEAALAGTKRIHVPFDQAIVVEEFRPTVLESVYALQDQGDALAQVPGRWGCRSIRICPNNRPVCRSGG